MRISSVFVQTACLVLYMRDQTNAEMRQLGGGMESVVLVHDRLDLWATLDLYSPDVGLRLALDLDGLPPGSAEVRHRIRSPEIR